MRLTSFVRAVLKLAVAMALLGYFGLGTISGQELPASPDPATESSAAPSKALAEGRAFIERLTQELKALEAELPAKLEALANSQLTQAVVDQARVDADTARLRQQDLQLEISNTEQDIKDLTQTIRDLEAREQLLKNPAKGEVDSSVRMAELEQVQSSLQRKKAELELQNQRLKILGEINTLLTRRLALAEQWLARVEEAYRLQQEKSRSAAEQDLTQRLRTELQGYLNRAAELARQLESGRDAMSEASRRLLSAKIQDAEERARLTQLDIRMVAMENDLERAENVVAQADAGHKELSEGLERLGSLQKEIRSLVELLRSKIALFEQQISVISRREGLTAAAVRLSAEETRIIRELIQVSKERLARAEELLAKVDAVRVLMEQNYKKSISKSLLVREKLPATSDEWGQLLEAVTNVPKILLYQMRLSAESTIKAIAQSSTLRWLSLALLELGVLWLVVVIRRSLGRAVDRLKALEDSSFFGVIVLTVLRLSYKNLLGAGLAAAFLMAIFMFQVPQPGLGIIITLVLLWIGIKTPVNLAWLLLASPRLPPGQQRPSLYRQVFWTLLIGGVLAAVIILAHLSALPDNVISIFDRGFMLFLLLAVVPVLRIRRLLVDLLAERYGESFWFISLRIVSLLLPLSLLAAAVMGLAGYLNLAWWVAWHLLIFILVLVGWQVIRRLLDDVTVVLKNYVMTHTSYGLLWTQDVINPLHKVLNIVLFLGAWWMLFQLYGWDIESATATAAWRALEYPLFSVGGAEISLWGVGVTALIVVVVVWIGQWSRTVTYRWVFSRISDLGVRHSLSAFTQYTVVLVGFLITLNLVGLDLTTVTVFAGALGVGIGLGMQDIAKNFVSGVLLLIERPLRSGDTVQIGTNTGEITRIGIRSLTMKTWDNMEVMIPNADVISTAFTNWTHSDNVVRTILMVGARYDADPHKVRQILEQVLSNHKHVLREPEWLVLFWEFGEAVLTFRVQYFTDFFKSNLLEVRAEILFAIWDGFRQAGIGIPYPRRDLHIKEWPDGVAMVSREQMPSLPPMLSKGGAIGVTPPAR